MNPLKRKRSLPVSWLAELFNYGFYFGYYYLVAYFTSVAYLISEGSFPISVMSFFFHVCLAGVRQGSADFIHRPWRLLFT